MEDPSSWVYEDDNDPKHDYSVEEHRRLRAERGFSTYDWWNFNSYLSWVIIQGLEKFKTGAGHPVYGGVATMEEWVAVLDEMIDGFKAIEAIVEHDRPKDIPYDEWEAGLRAKWERGMELFTTFYGSLWD
jgi:hypothetical protein